MNAEAVRHPTRRRIASALFLALAFLFLGYLVAGNVDALREHRWTVRPGLLLISLLVHIGALVWGVAVWRALLRRIGHDVPLPVLSRIWFVSGLGRYIPGKIWQFVGAAQLGGAAGLPAALTVTSLAAHTGIFLLAALLLGIYLIPLGTAGAIGGVTIGVLRWIAPLALVAIHPRVISFFLALLRRTTRRDIGSWTGSWIDGLWILILATIGWVLTGAALHLFILSLTPIDPNALRAVIAINAISFVAGYLVFFVPAGLGAREGVLAALLSIYMPPPVAALTAIAVRLWTVAAEVLPALALLRTGSAPVAAPPLPGPPEGGR